MFCFCFSPTLIDNLLIDYQFTFSLLQEDDQHYSAINFMATPEEVSEFASSLCNRLYFILSFQKSSTFCVRNKCNMKSFLK